MYKKYEQIINDVEYDASSDRILLINVGTVNLNYV